MKTRLAFIHFLEYTLGLYTLSWKHAGTLSIFMRTRLDFIYFHKKKTRLDFINIFSWKHTGTLSIFTKTRWDFIHYENTRGLYPLLWKHGYLLSIFMKTHSHTACRDCHTLSHVLTWRQSPGLHGRPCHTLLCHDSSYQWHLIASHTLPCHDSGYQWRLIASHTLP